MAAPGPGPCILSDGRGEGLPAAEADGRGVACGRGGAGEEGVFAGVFAGDFEREKSPIVRVALLGAHEFRGERISRERKGSTACIRSCGHMYTPN